MGEFRRRKKRRVKKSRRSYRDDVAIFIALGIAFVAGLTVVALWVALPTLQSLWALN